MYYEFLKTGFEVFTYKRPRKFILFALSVGATLVTLFGNILAAMAFTFFTVLAYKKLEIKEAILITLVAEFGFMIAFISLYFIFTTLGTIFGIEGLELNLDWDELIHYAMHS
ncbi:MULTISPECIES: hypothetical protein [Pyrococcus]|nr:MULTISPECIES: hypothetical protein [Pyrococcus]